MTVNRDAVQQFVDQLAEKLGRSVAVDDRHRHYVTSSRHFGDLDGLRVNVLVSRHLDDKSSAYLYSFVDAANLKGPIRIPANDDLGITVRRCYPVQKNGEWVGFLWLIGEATEAEDRIVAASLSEFAHILSQEPDRTAQQEAVVWATFLKILSLPDRRHELRDSWQGQLIDPQTTIAVVVAYAHQEPEKDRVYQAQILNELIARSIHDRRIIRTTSVARGRIALTIVRDQHRRSPDKAGFPLVNSLARLEHDRLSVGLSSWGPVTEAEELLTQAVLAAYAAFAGNKRCLSWPDCTFQGILLRTALNDPAQVIPAPVSELAATGSGAVLLKTVSVFLEESGDISRASQRLNIHRTTLYYRLARIEELTGYDLKNGNDRLALQIGGGLISFLETELPLFLQSEEN
ncbi:PucR family transcriptional regulator [Arthrobacter crystallopoietes]|uniref:PucR family transcriptional regulator n=1 Tax=Crystallibacter crystallopoietes TaxID=37928 RepID=UPI001ABD9CFB|nr:helix-turn-helix domain-containing protein [Arthrobacter crystallopoietes]QTG81771.1 helix-turn-helix domain-containing protein [Arthrobacter crystallopoietes]